MIKLIATDMDGTLLRDDKTFDIDRLATLLPRLAECGIQFAAASGNNLTKLYSYFAGLTDQMAFVAENGALLAIDGDVTFRETLSREQWQQVVSQLLEFPLMTGQRVLLSGVQHSYVLASADPSYQRKMRFFYPNLRLVEDLHAVDDEITKVTMNLEPEVVARGEAFLNQIDGVIATTSGFQSIDVIRTGVSKATALMKLAAQTGAQADEIVVFGDNLNDLSMMQAVGFPVAMSNGVPAVREAAKKVIGTNNDDAVLDEIENILRGAKEYV